MIPFEQYLGKYVVLITNSVSNKEEVSGIRINESQVFSFKKKWVLARPLTLQDLKDDDFIHWLNSVWNHDELTLKKFIRHGKKEANSKKKLSKRSN